MSVCEPLEVVDLGRFDRIFIEWPIGGVSESASASIQLEGTGQWHPLVIADGWASGFFAGPNFPNPSPAIGVPATAHTVLRIVDGLIQVDRDGGIIRVTL